jgi:hypothetical protein
MLSHVAKTPAKYRVVQNLLFFDHRKNLTLGYENTYRVSQIWEKAP